ncbi:unnamed protein product [Miscanthus lutarioriparius]|uniref:Uncharacterized protein n=1 Tax=Miscanthus lutarioriparius TaxID=422564 RepID=A0A811NCT8_9POAL|nr:unnamed protein product [Miscanthus lutarioriparius]
MAAARRAWEAAAAVLARVAASMVRARKGLWAPAPGRTRPPRRLSSTTLRSALRAQEAARAAGSEEDEAATAAADNDYALAASRSHFEARSRGPERAPRLSLQHPWLRPQGAWCGDGRPRNILAYNPKTAGFLVASDAARIALLIRLFKASCCVLYSAIPAVAPPKQHMDAWFRLPGSGRDASLRSRPCRLEQRLPASTIQCWGYFLHCSPFIKNYWSYFLHGYFLHENCRISATLTTYFCCV